MNRIDTRETWAERHPVIATVAGALAFLCIVGIGLYTLALCVLLITK